MTVSVFAQQKGFGFSYNYTNDSLRVNKVFENSPAAKAGIKTKDLIEKINGVAVKGNTMESITDILSQTEKAAFLVKRGSQSMNISVTKAIATTYDRKCFSGDCVNGEGKALLYSTNRIYEGRFENGVPTGKVKIYTPKSQLLFEGTYVNNKAEGEGTLLYETGEERYVGLYKNGEFVEGYMYYKDGKIFCKGKYVNGNLVAGYFKTTYRGKPVFLFCDKIEGFGTDKVKYYGEVTRRADVPGGVIVSKGYYDGVWKHGWFDEYEYENDAKFVIHYNQGGIWPGDAKIFRISDGKQIAERVMFPRNASDYGNEIEEGSFNFAGKTLSVGNIGRYHTIADLKKEYYSKYGGGTISNDIAGTLMLFYKGRGRPGVVHAFTIHSKSKPSTSQIESIVSELRAKHGDKLTSVGFVDYTFVPGVKCSETMSLSGRVQNGNSYTDDDFNTIYCLDPYVLR